MTDEIEKFKTERGMSTSHRYRTKKGEISLVYLVSFTGHQYEIYCIDGDLFEDIERYETKEEAEERIKGLLL